MAEVLGDRILSGWDSEVFATDPVASIERRCLRNDTDLWSEPHRLWPTERRSRRSVGCGARSREI